MRWLCFTAGLALLSIAATAAHADLKISSAATQNVTCSNGVCTATAKNAVLNVSDLAGLLSGGDVIVQSGSAAQDIDIDAALSWANTSRLTLDSYRFITFNRPVSVTGTGAMTITTNDGGSGGDFRFFGRGHIRFWDLTSSLIINGNPYTLFDHVKRIGKEGTFEALARSINLHDKTYTSAPAAWHCCGGVVEGLGNTISYLTINAAQDGCAALICYLDTGTVRDIGLLAVSITAGDRRDAGAIAAQAQFGTVIANSYAGGSVSAGSNSRAGGLVSISGGMVSHSYAAVKVSGGDETEVGGLIGRVVGEDNTGSIDQSYATGTVSGGEFAIVGGLFGANYGAMISNSYAKGSASGTAGALVGGLLGSNANNAGQGFLHTVYATGLVSGGSGAIVGGLIGDDESSDSISDVYWDLDTSGISDPHQGAGNIPDDPGITGLTDVQLKSGLPAGFDKHIWKQNPKINNGYPYLADNPPP